MPRCYMVKKACNKYGAKEAEARPGELCPPREQPPAPQPPLQPSPLPVHVVAEYHHTLYRPQIQQPPHHEQGVKPSFMGPQLEVFAAMFALEMGKVVPRRLESCPSFQYRELQHVNGKIRARCHER
ncbi:hypothetical protein AAG570_012031 [Ranatra chinensis]|uniref:Uncharacterized protein n=1 Tax=Ranatra chinensis TaxID=642074 RepID=A0ABD0YHM0_9HEMI